MRALSIRQPYAELILRGIKTVEYRSRATKIVGERFWIYASKKKLPVASGRLPVWSEDLAVARPPGWMIELAEQVGMIDEGARAGLPTGVIVGSAVIEKVVCCEAGGEGLARAAGLSGVAWSCTAGEGEALAGEGAGMSAGEGAGRGVVYAWHLAEARRAKRLRRPEGHPQPVWFKPW